MKIKKPRYWGIPYSVFFILIITIIVLSTSLIFLIHNLTQENRKYRTEIEDISYKLEQLLSIDVSNLEEQSFTINITMPSTDVAPESLSDALSIMQNQYSDYMTNLNLILTVFAIIISLFTLGIPIFNYAFLQMDQVKSLKETEKNITKTFDSEVEKVSVNVNRMKFDVNEEIQKMKNEK